MSQKPFHPILFALAPGIIMLAANVSQVQPADALRILLCSVLLACALWAVYFLIKRDVQKSALLTSLTLLLFFSYGHVYSLLRVLAIGPFVIGRTSVVLPIYLVIFGAAIRWIWTRPSSANLIQTINVVTLFLVLVPLINISAYYIRSAATQAREASSFSRLDELSAGKNPSIYYVILDMHTRSDVLQGIYNYDDSDFINSLEELGFYVAEQSTSNYSSTLQSLSSSLNMEYVNYLEEIYGANSNDRAALGDLLKNNKVMENLAGLGYKLGAFQSGDFYTEFRNANIYIKPTQDQIRSFQGFLALNAFEGTFLQTTMVRVLYDLSVFRSGTAREAIETAYQLHRLNIVTILEHMPDFAQEPAPYFVFAHIVAPHPPYVFGPNGEQISHTEPFSFSGPGRQNETATEVQQYVDQVQYIDQRILEVVEAILSASETPPIIILQGDHGAVSYNGEDEVSRSNMKEQHAILNAYYFPGGRYDLVYPSVSPVNSFRIVFDTFFGGDYELLPDRNYFIPHARPYDFIDVTDRVETDPLVP